MRDSTVKDLDELHKKAKAAKSRFEGVWYLNLAYYENNQWLAWDGGRLFKPNLRGDRVTITDNRITPIVRTEVAKLTKNRPVFVCTPKTSDDQDIIAARTGETILQYQWAHLAMLENFTRALTWSRICGAGFLKVFWDSTLGDSMSCVCDEQGDPIMGQDQRPMRAQGIDPHALQALRPGARIKQVAQGDIVVEPRSPFQLFVDPLAETFSGAEWLIDESVKSQDYLQRRYGVTLQEDSLANPGLIESRLGGGIGGGGGGGSYKGVKVREYWSKPSSEHPNGRRAVWAADKLLTEDDQPHDPCPYVMFSSIPVPGRLWPSSIVEHLRGPQTQLNKLKSQIVENITRVGNPTWAASKQSITDPEQFEGAIAKPGGTIYYDETGAQQPIPQLLPGASLPQYVIEQQDRIEAAMQEISGQHEVTSAQVPAGVTAASAINLLQEADDTRLGPAIAEMEGSLGELGSKILSLVAKYYTDPRMIALVGENDAWDITEIRGSDLREHTHVEVQTASAFPQSKAAKQAALQNWFQLIMQNSAQTGGVSPKAMAQYLKQMDVGGAEQLIADYNKNEDQVNRENRQLSQGAQLPVNSYDDDAAHIELHQDFMKDSRYDRLDPQVKFSFEQHVQAHKDRSDQAQQAQQAQDPQAQAAMAQQQQAQQQAQLQQLQTVQGMANTQDQHEQSSAHADDKHHSSQMQGLASHAAKIGQQLQPPTGGQR